MGSRRAGRSVACLLAALCAAPALLAGAGGTPAEAAAPWWTPAALQGTPLTSVAVTGADIVVHTEAGTTLRSTDRGARFAPAAGAAAPPASPVQVTSGGYTWSIAASGQVRRAQDGKPTIPDPGAPNLGAGAHLLAAPATLPGVVVAVATDGTIWRRAQDGGWSRSFLLLPQSLVQGVPAVTSITAFSQPISNAVYVGTDGYAALLTNNGGDDWVRAGAELPDRVTGLAADGALHSVYAATSDGLWVHVLRALPAPPRYPDRALLARWLGIAAVTLIAAALAVLGMIRLAPDGDG